MLLSRTRSAIQDAPVASHSHLASALLVVLGTVFIAITAQIAVPIGPVPISGQTLGVLLVAAALGLRRGTTAVALYVAEGLAGLPVFAGGRAGFAVLAGPTGGYLVGFVVAAALVGWLCSFGFSRRPVAVFLIMCAGSVVIYLFGASWLSRFVGWEQVYRVGVAPFLFGDALKAAIATIAVPTAWRIAERKSSRSG